MATDYRKYILSTGTHWISNSGSDENGNLKGGKAGDQNGKEWRLRGWYNRPWTCVLRFPDAIAATLIAQLGIDAALNDKIGYDQGQRDSFWREVRKVGYLPAKITTPCEEDCTAGVNGLVHCAAYLLDIPALKKIPETGVRSGNMRKYYRAAGFRVLTEPRYLNNGDYLLPGDILLYDNHHGATNVTCGRKVRSGYAYHDVIDHLDEYRGKTDPTEDGLRRGDSGPEVEAMQQRLLKWNHQCLPEYGADGDFGKETEDAVKDFQKEKGLPVTGVYDAATEKALIATTSGVSERHEGAEGASAGAQRQDAPETRDPANAEGAGRRVEITGGSVNVRSAPGTSSRDIGTVHKGDILEYRGETRRVGERDWYRVEFLDGDGWVSDKYAELVE